MRDIIYIWIQFAGYKSESWPSLRKICDLKSDSNNNAPSFLRLFIVPVKFDIFSSLGLISLLFCPCGSGGREWHRPGEAFLSQPLENIVKVEIRDVEGSDYELGGAAFTKELALKTKDNKAEKIRLTQKTNLFNKNVKVVWANNTIVVKSWTPTQVSSCGESGCSDGSLGAEEEEWVFSDVEASLRPIMDYFLVFLDVEASLIFFSGDSVLVQWEARIWPRVYSLHLWVPREGKHGYIAHVKKGSSPRHWSHPRYHKSTKSWFLPRASCSSTLTEWKIQAKANQ